MKLIFLTSYQDNFDSKEWDPMKQQIHCTKIKSPPFKGFVVVVQLKTSNISVHTFYHFDINYTYKMQFRN